MYDFLSPRFAYNNSALNKNVTERIMKVQKCAVFYLGGGGNNFRNHKLKLGAFIFINKSGLIFFFKGADYPLCQWLYRSIKNHINVTSYWCRHLNMEPVC